MKKACNKATASLFTIFCFFVAQFGPNLSALARPVEVINFSNLSLPIPSDLGRLQYYKPSSAYLLPREITDHKSQIAAPLIIHIQTAHGNYEAQKKIEALLHYFEETYGIRLLFVEGSAFKLDPEALRPLNVQEEMDRTMDLAEALTKKALLKGADLFLLKEKNAEAYGIENVEAYRSNFEAFQAVLKAKERTAQFVAQINRQIEYLTGPLLNKNLREFLSRLENYKSKRTPIFSWLSELKAYAQKYLEMDLSDPVYQIDWPTLVRIYTLSEIESKIDKQLLDQERDRFLKAIRPIPREIYQAVEKLLSSPTSLPPEKQPDPLLPDPNTRMLFEKMVASLPAHFNYEAYPHLRYFIGHLILQSEIKGERLAEEITRLEDQIAEKLASTAEEKKIVSLLKDRRLLKKLFALELVPEDYEKIISNPAIRPSALIKRFVELMKLTHSREVPLDRLGEIDFLFDKALEFYTGVKERDFWMLQNITNHLKQTGSKKAVVITGGFHTGPFRQFFENQNFSYALITPRITEVGSRDPYLYAMLQEVPNLFAASTIETPELLHRPSDLSRLVPGRWRWYLSQVNYARAEIRMSKEGDFNYTDLKNLREEPAKAARDIRRTFTKDEDKAQILLDKAREVRREFQGSRKDDKAWELFLSYRNWQARFRRSSRAELRTQEAAWTRPDAEKIAVIGAAGFVGFTKSVTLAFDWGHDVIGVDIDAGKADRLNRGELVNYIPKTELLLKEGLQSGRLRFTSFKKEDLSPLAEALKGRELVFLALPTPQNPRGEADISYLKEAVRQIVQVANPGEKKLLIVKSTVPPGTTASLKKVAEREILRKRLPQPPIIRFAREPEYLREGNELDDDRGGSGRIDIAAEEAEDRDRIAQLYDYKHRNPLSQRKDMPINRMGIPSAELVKYAANGYRGTKISFINLAGWFTGAFGFDVNELADTLGQDHRILRSFLNCGLGFGGSCFPKDFKAFIQVARKAHVPADLLLDVLAINELQWQKFKERIVKELGGVKNKTIVILGASFKPDTSDVREARSKLLIESLLREGAHIRVFDPKAVRELEAEFRGDVNIEYFSHFSELKYEGGVFGEADAVVLVTEWSDFRNLDFKKLKEGFEVHGKALPHVFDGRNIWKPEEIRNLGFPYTAIGRAEKLDKNIAVDKKEFFRNMKEFFLALRISFMNLLAEIAEAEGANIRDVRKSLGYDPVIFGGNADSPNAYLSPGLGFGGHALPHALDYIEKHANEHLQDDLKRFREVRKKIARELGMRPSSGDSLRIPFVTAIRDINKRQIGLYLKKAKQAVGGSLKGKKVAVLGLAFKPGTSSIKNASSLELIKALLKEGAIVHAADEDRQAIANVRREFSREEEKLSLFLSPKDAVATSDLQILVTEWKEYRGVETLFFHKEERLEPARRAMVDGRHFYDPAKVQSLGIDYFAVGIPSQVASRAEVRLDTAQYVYTHEALPEPFPVILRKVLSQTKRGESDIIAIHSNMLNYPLEAAAPATSLYFVKKGEVLTFEFRSPHPHPPARGRAEVRTIVADYGEVHDWNGASDKAISHQLSAERSTELERVFTTAVPMVMKYFADGIIPVYLLEQFRPRVLAEFLTAANLFGKPLHAATDGLVPKPPASLLGEGSKVKMADGFLNPQTPDFGFVLLDQKWLGKFLKDKDPQELFLLLNSFRDLKHHAGIKEPLLAVVGNRKDTLNLIRNRLAQLLKGESMLETTDKIVLAQRILPEVESLIQIIEPSQDQTPEQAINSFIQKNQFGVAALLSELIQIRGEANFFLDPDRVHSSDIPAVVVALLALRKAAQLLYGVEDPEMRHRLILERIPNILPGARPAIEGGVSFFVIQLAEFVEHLKSTRSLEISA